MKFSFTQFGQLKKLMLVLNEQAVFDANWDINPIRSETVVSLNLDSPGRPVSSHSSTELLYQFLSNKKRKVSLLNLIGAFTTQYILDPAKFQAFLEISKERLVGNYRNVTWFDVTLLLLICQLHEKDSPDSVWAATHLAALYSKNPAIEDSFNFLADRKINPVW